MKLWPSKQRSPAEAHQPGHLLTPGETGREEPGRILKLLETRRQGTAYCVERILPVLANTVAVLSPSHCSGQRFPLSFPSLMDGNRPGPTAPEQHPLPSAGAGFMRKQPPAGMPAQRDSRA